MLGDLGITWCWERRGGSAVLFLGGHSVAPRDLHGGSFPPQATASGTEVQSSCLCHSYSTLVQKQSGQKKQTLLQHAQECLVVLLATQSFVLVLQKDEGGSRHLTINYSCYLAGLMLLVQSRQISENMVGPVSLAGLGRKRIIVKSSFFFFREAAP